MTETQLAQINEKLAKLETIETRVDRVKRTSKSNQDAIAELKRVIEEDETGIKAIRYAVAANQTAIDKLASKADLSDLEKQLLKQEKRDSRWYRDHRVAITALGVSGLLLLVRLVEFVVGLAGQTPSA